MFDPPSLPPFCVTSFFEWILTRGQTENTAKVKSFVCLFWQLCNITYIFPKSYLNPVIPPDHSSRRVLCILYSLIVGVWGGKYWSRITKKTIANSIGCYGGSSRSSTLRWRYSEIMQHSCRRTLTLKCDFNIKLWHGYYPVNLLHISRLCHE